MSYFKYTVWAALLAACAWGKPAPSKICVLEAEEASTLRLDGDSSLHTYFAVTSELVVDAEAEIAGPACEPSKISGIRKLSVRIPAKSLRSDKESLNDNMYKALRTDEFQEVVFVLSKAVPVESPPGEGARFQATGDLMVAGAHKEISVAVSVVAQGRKIHFRGKQELKMTDFKIEPPTMLLGTIKTYDPVTISFDIIFGGGNPETVAK